MKDKLVEVPRTVLENCGKLLEQSLEAIAKSHDIAEESAATFCLQKKVLEAHKQEIDSFIG